MSDDAKKVADTAKGQFMQASLVIYKGPLKDNTGKEVIPPGQELVQKAVELESMDWLVEGVLGKAGS